MVDPSEAEHDRLRRWLMNLALLLIVLLNIAEWRTIGVHGLREWLTVMLLAVAAVPCAVAVRVFELRFKMAAGERRQALRQLPAKRKWEFVVCGLLCLPAFVLNATHLSCALLGVWVYDFVSYYHDRPERMRHLYTLTSTLDLLRDFPAPWMWPLPVLAVKLLF
jgi:hypothetical protein